MKNEEYERLYDKITEVTNEVIVFCGGTKFAGGLTDAESDMLTRLMARAGELQEVAHEVEEHFAWD